MATSDVDLLGGVLNDGVLHRRARLRDLTGDLEEQLAAHERPGLTGPRRVTRILAAIVETVGDIEMDEDRCAGLCVADRQLLMVEVARRIAGAYFWIQPRCIGCDVAFDVRIDRSMIPRKPAGEGFPFASVQIGRVDVDLRAPTGADQDAVTGLDPKRARTRLLQRCVEAVNRRPPPETYVRGLSTAETSVLEKTLEDVSPELGTVMSTSCPECETSQMVAFDPYRFGVELGGRLLEDVHTIASCYHWSETEILSLPRQRREDYLSLIESSRGMHG